MSRATRNAARAKATWWSKAQEDEYGRSSFGAPVVLNVAFDDETSIKYSPNGIENSPNVVIWFEKLDGENPKEGDFIAVGSHANSPEPIDDAEVVTIAKHYDCSLLRQKDDMMVVA